MAVFLNVWEIGPRREFHYIWILKIYLLHVVQTSELLWKKSDIVVSIRAVTWLWIRWQFTLWSSRLTPCNLSHGPMLQSKILPPSPSGWRQYVFPNEGTHLKDCKVSEPRISQHESSWPRKPQILEKRVWLYYKMEMMDEEAFIAYYEEW